MLKSLRAVLRKSRSLWTGVIAGFCVFAVMRWVFPAPPPTVCFIRQFDSHSADKMLEREIDSVDFDEVPFKEVLAWLVKTQKLNVVVAPDDRTMEHFANYPITLHARNLTAKRLLDSILFRTDDELHWFDRDGVITIGERVELNTRGLAVTRLYDIRSILADATKNADRFAPASIANWGFSGPDVPGTVELQPDALRADELIKFLTDHVAAETWQVNGGDREIAYANGKLVISQTEQVHQQIENMLRMLFEDH